MVMDNLINRVRKPVRDQVWLDHIRGTRIIDFDLIICNPIMRRENVMIDIKN